MKTTLSVLTAILLSISIASSPVSAAPAIPNSFYGSLTINGAPAPAGTSVEAKGTGVRTGLAGNPIVTAEAGYYGSADGFGNLIVQGDIADGATLSFNVNGMAAGQTATWHSGQITQLNLTVGTATATPAVTTTTGGGGNAPASTPAPASTASAAIPVALQLNGLIDDRGKFTTGASVALPSGEATLDIETGTTGMTIDGKSLSVLSLTPAFGLPKRPADANAVAFTYDFGPTGAVFDRPVTITLKYDPARLTSNASEASLFIAWYDPANGKWVQLTGTVDIVNHTISAKVSHFTIFTVLEPVKVSAASSPLIEKTPDVEKSAATPAPSKTETIPATPAPSEPTNWWLISGIAAGALLVVLAVWLIFFRPRGY